MAAAGDIDTTNYQSWEKITAPSGAVYFAVPGTGLVYDPTLTNVKGRKVFWTNPRAQLDAQKKAEQANSPINQALGLAGGVAGTVGANYAVNALSPGATAAGAIPATAGTTAGAGSVAGGVTPSAASNFITGATGSGAGYSTAANGAISGYSGGGGLATTAAEGVGTQGLTTGGFGAGVAPYALGAGGAYGLYDTFANKKSGGKGAAQGGLSGAALGFALGGPVGALIGLGLGGGAGYFGNFGDVDAFKNEGKDLRKLADEGYKVDANNLAMLEGLKKGRSVDELVKIEQDKIANGGYGNVEFAKSRNEGLLTPQDIQGYSSIYRQAGKEGTDADRMELAKRALEAGAVREAKGQIEVDWSKVNTDLKAKQQDGKQQSKPKQEVKMSTDEELGKKLANRINKRSK